MTSKENPFINYAIVAINESSSYKVPTWWEILIGVLLIVGGATLFFLFPKSKREVQYYKQLQLEKYKKENPKFVGDYNKAKLLLPWGQRMKLVMWPIIGLSIILIGIFFVSGVMFTFFTR